VPKYTTNNAKKTQKKIKNEKEHTKKTKKHLTRSIYVCNHTAM